MQILLEIQIKFDSDITTLMQFGSGTSSVSNSKQDNNEQ